MCELWCSLPSRSPSSKPMLLMIKPFRMSAIKHAENNAISFQTCVLAVAIILTMSPRIQIVLRVAIVVAGTRAGGGPVDCRSDA